MARSDQDKTTPAPLSAFRLKVIGAFGAASIFQVIGAATHILFTAILSRLLTPAEIGAATSAQLFTSILASVCILGFSSTLVQAVKLTDEAVAAVSTIVLVSGFVFLGIALIAAPWVAAWFRDAQLIGPVRFMGLICVANCIGFVPVSLLRRQLKAAQLGAIELTSGIIGLGLVSIPLAIAGAGMWAQIAGSVAIAWSKAMIAYAIVRPTSGYSLNLKPAVQFFTKAFGFSMSSLLQSVTGQTDRLAVGRWLGAANLGQYSAGSSLTAFPVTMFAAIAERVIFPAFAALQLERERLAAAFLEAIALLALVCLSVSAVMAATAPQIVAVVLGKQWVLAAAPMAILAPMFYLRIAERTCASLLRGVGRVFILSATQLLFGLLTLGACFVGSQFGLKGVAIGVLSACFCSWLVLVIAVMRTLKLRPGSILLAHAPGLVMAGLTGGAALTASRAADAVGAVAFFNLAAAGLAAGVVGLVALLIAPRWFLGHRSMMFIEGALATARQRLRPSRA
ncbi:lipopolysaccharide biosynthesis protein [soil metagenome]